MRLVLREYADPQIAGVDQIGQHEVDQPIGTAEGNRWLGAVGGHWIQPLALTAGPDNAQHLWRFPHASNLTAIANPCQIKHLSTHADGLSINKIGGLLLTGWPRLHGPSGTLTGPGRRGAMMTRE